MENEIVKFEFNQQLIDFELSENLMVNATQMAKIFGKDVPDFLILKQTKDFISECLNNQNSGYLGIEKEDDLVVSKQKSGTWMHRILALKLAAWLDPKFELWVYLTIDSILFDKYKKIEDRLKKRADRKDKIDLIKDQLRNDEHTGNAFKELERLELEDKQDTNSQGREIRNQLDLFRNQGI